MSTLWTSGEVEQAVSPLAMSGPFEASGVTFDSRAATSLLYGVLVFSPVFCAGLLFSRSFRRSESAAADFGANLLGAMVGGTLEYLSLITGYQFLLIVTGVLYGLAFLTGRRRVAAQRGT